MEASLNSILSSCDKFECEHLSDVEKLVKAILQKLRKDIASTSPHSRPLPQEPNALQDEIMSMKNEICMLQTAVPKLQNSPVIPMSEPPSNADTTQTKLSTPQDKDTWKTKPHPSIIAHIAWSETNPCPHPHTICVTVNKVLSRSKHSQVHILAAKWMARDNIILTGGATNSLKQLLAAKVIIRQGLYSRLPFLSPQTNPLPITANMKWSKILINHIPTGISSTRGPWTPEECHDALLTENPSYAALTITQKPSWIKPTNTYKQKTTSSLVFAFEDPDSNFAHNIITSEFFYAFGTRATVNIWKEQLKTHSIDAPCNYKHCKSCLHKIEIHRYN